MKTRFIAMSLLAGAAVMISSCQSEKNMNSVEIGENEVAFKIGAVQTRSSAEISPERTVVATKSMEGGEKLFLEETVENLNEGIVTKGTPAFTANVATLYGSFFAHELAGNGVKLDDAAFTFDKDDEQGYWKHRYGMNVWNESLLPYTFFLRMPVDPEGVSGYKYNDDGSMEFDYTSPATTGKGQQDILFTSTTMTSQDENGKKVIFYHALTGIKFANFYTNAESDTRTVAKTKIKEVSLTGMKNSGHAKVKADGTVEWTELDGNVTFTQTFDEENFADYTKPVGENNIYLIGDKDKGGLNETAAQRNLNDNNGSLTFWVVPQVIEAGNVTITVKFDITLVDKDGKTTGTFTDETLTVTLVKQAEEGAEPKTMEWKAGQLHTFTLKPVKVGVDIKDEMSDYVKKNVVVENHGNVYEYVRVNLIGNWVGNLWKSGEGENTEYEKDETILFGYTNATGETLVEAWNDKDGYTNYGKFEKLTPKSSVVPATAENTVNNWVRYDKYYYYIKPIGPDDSVTDQLFEYYEVGKSPDVWIADAWGNMHKAGNVHLVMDLSVQAIPAPVDNDGNVIDNDDNQGYIRAWKAALKTDDKEVDLLDL